MNRKKLEYYERVGKEVWDKINQPGFPKTRCGTPIIKYILLNYSTDISFIEGKAVEFRKRNLGCGVYECWMEEKK